MVISNKYPEAFKIALVKRYLNGEKQKKLCAEYHIAKSTLWGWTCKYQNLIFREWEIKADAPVSESGMFVDIRKKTEESIKSSIIQQTDNNVRIFVNGYAIICSINRLNDVLRIINNG